MNIGKKLISLLTAFCLTLSLVPTVALAADATSVTVDGTSVVGSSTTYYKNKGYTGGLKNGNANDYNVKYEPDTHTLTLNNYQGSSIYSNDYLTINVEGQDNKIKNIEYSNNAILVYDNLTITGTGRLESEASKNRSTIYVAKNLTINGGVTLIVPGGSSGQSIHTVGGSIVISDSNTVVKATNGYSQGVVRSGDINGYGTIELKDGATLTADQIDVKQNGFLVNGKVNTDKTNINTTAGATYTIFGMVTNGTTPVKNALVQLCTADTVASSEPTVISYSTTETNGTYTLSNVPAGSYIIKVTKEGYNDFTTASFAVSGNVTNKNLILTPIALSQYTVTINAESNMTPTGSASQTVTAGQPMTSVTYTSESDFYFPENYSNIITNNITINGIVVTRTSSREITVSGIPTANTTINLTAPIPKTKPNAPSPTAIDCTTESNNDGKITGVNNTMEYKAENASDWSFISGDTIENLASGTYYVRVKATDTTLASENATVTVGECVTPVTKYNIWIAGTQVTSTNKDNVLGDSKTTHSVVYNPTDKKLTLSGAQIQNTANTNQAGTQQGNIETAGIMTTLDNLTIDVTGNSTISSTNGHAIAAKNLVITATDNNSLQLNGNGNMRAISIDYADTYKYKLAIMGNVAITATVTPKAGGNGGSQADGIVIVAYDISVQDSATLTAKNEGENLAIYCTGTLAVKDFATLTAKSVGNNHAISVTNFNYPNHSVTASKNYDGSNPAEPFEPNQLDIYKYVKVEPIRVTSVTLSESNLSLKTNQTATLTATVNPSDAAVRDVTWASSDTNVARVNTAGATCEVTAVGVGTATITVTTTDGSCTASCTVTVTNASSSSGSHTTYYPVNTPAKSEGGYVVVSPKSASKGSAVTVTVTPESGYQVSSVQAVDEDGKKLTLTDKGDGKYSFVMPGSKVEVSASFAQVQKPEEPSPYRDVSKDSYYYDAVQWASDKGITNGVADGVFAPDWVCTRGQIVTFLWRSVGSPAPKTAEMPFADVSEDAYYAQAVLWAVENGITKGTSETTFSPDQTCTRAHAVAFLYRLAGSPAVTGSSFQDVAADAYYNAAVAWAVQQGITNGTSETTFSPDETCTRAQIVTFLYRMDQAK